MNLIARFGRLSVTALAVLAAALVGWQVWYTYVDAPWTRDGRVGADVIGVAPDVSGPVAEVLVHDEQTVRRGDVLLRIDRIRFEIAVQQAEAVVAARKATLDQSVRDYNRYRQLDTLSTSQQKQEQTIAEMQLATAAYRQALADQRLAELNLERTEVKAPADGIVTNLDLRPGDYVSTGKAVFALVDTATLRVEGYFEETKLQRLAVGDRVSVRLMGVPGELHGHVTSIAAGIADRERSASADMLANVNPTFTWVRLAQRVPVRVKLDDVPDDVALVVGRTATVVVQNAAERRSPGLLSWLR